MRVDEYLCAGPEDVYVAGDIAVFPFAYATDPIVSEVRIEHWDVAIDHGRVAARNMLGQRKPYRSVPYFWTAQLGRPVRSAGYCFRIDETIVHGDLEAADPSRAAATVYYVQGGKVASVVTVGLADNTAVAAMELFRLNAMPSPQELKAVTSFSLPDLLTQVTTAGAAAAAASAGGGRRKSPARGAAAGKKN